jgi:hypothetical protein
VQAQLLDEYIALLNPKLTISRSNVPACHTVVYSLPVEILSSEDIVNLICQYEITNNTDALRKNAPAIPVVVARYVVRCEKPNETSGSKVLPKTGVILTDENYYFHENVQTVETGMLPGMYFYNLVLYCSSSQAKSGDYINVHPRQGFLKALVFRGPRVLP